MKTHTFKRAWWVRAVFGFCLVFLFLIINKVYADVYINEVAWMGTTVSSTNEWIELYNDGVNDVDLDGWVIVSDDGSPNITISSATNSVVGEKKYYLIERTDDTTVPDVTADFVAAFGSGLSNSGEALLLKKPDGTIVETLDFKSGWPAGDNTTKQTMQRVGSAWVTATPTPRAVNAGAVVQTAGGTGGGTGSTVNVTASSETTKKEVVPPKPKISIISSKTILTNVSASFDALYTNSSNVNVLSGYFVWSMGDGTTYTFTQQKKFTHIYQYPGDYTVSVAYFYNSWSEDPIIETNTVVHVGNAGVSVSAQGTDGTILVKNSTDQDINISKWQIYEGSNVYSFPYGMVVLANKSIVVPARVTGFNGLQNPTLYYPSGLAYANSNANNFANQSTPVIKNIAKNNIPNTNANIVYKNYNPQTAIGSSVVETTNTQIINSENPVPLSANALGTAQTKNTRWWVFVVFGIIVCGLGYLAMKLYRSKPDSATESFHLVDE